MAQGLLTVNMTVPSVGIRRVGTGVQLMHDGMIADSNGGAVDGRGSRSLQPDPATNRAVSATMPTASHVNRQSARAQPVGHVRSLQLHIDSRESLARLGRTLWFPFAIAPGTRIVFDARTFGRAAVPLQTRANKLHAACGCSTAALAVMSTFVLQMVWWVSGGLESSVGATLRGIGLLVAAAICGKLAGILANRVRLSLLLRHVDRRFARQWEHPSHNPSRVRLPLPTEP